MDQCCGLADYLAVWFAQPSLKRAFPDVHHPPTLPDKRVAGGCVTPLISLDLPEPEIRAGRRPFKEVTLVPVPEASLDKQHRPVTVQQNVRLARQTFYMSRETVAV